MKASIYSVGSILAFLVLLTGLIFMPFVTATAQDPPPTPEPPPPTPEPPPETPQVPPTTAPPEPTAVPPPPSEPQSPAATAIPGATPVPVVMPESGGAGGGFVLLLAGLALTVAGIGVSVGRRQ